MISMLSLCMPNNPKCFGMYGGGDRARTPEPRRGRAWPSPTALRPLVQRLLLTNFARELDCTLYAHAFVPLACWSQVHSNPYLRDSILPWYVNKFNRKIRLWDPPRTRHFQSFRSQGGIAIWCPCTGQFETVLRGPGCPGCAPGRDITHIYRDASYALQ